MCESFFNVKKYILSEEAGFQGGFKSCCLKTDYIEFPGTYSTYRFIWFVFR